MDLLVLGGTQFVGRAIVEVALARGHAVTLFHRGKTNPGLFPNAEEILGDRDGGLEALRGRSWDCVIDVNGYVPRLVRDSVRLLTSDPRTRYLFISTLSVLADYTIPNQTESAPRVSFEGVDTEEITWKSYGPLKAACEDVVEREMAGRYTVLRPGFVVGPWDNTGRFTYWLRRATEGGTMLAPGSPASPAQIIDARDLGAFAVHAAEGNLKGTYHAVGPREPLTWGEVFEIARGKADTRVVYVPYDFLKSRDVSLPMRFAGEDGLERTSIAKAIAAGLTFRPLGDTIRDTLAWDAEHRIQAGPTAEQERDLLAAWGQTTTV